MTNPARPGGTVTEHQHHRLMATPPTAPRPQPVYPAVGAHDRALVAGPCTCAACLDGRHQRPPAWHIWADAEDLAHAEATGSPSPGAGPWARCACWCADATDFDKWAEAIRAIEDAIDSHTTPAKDLERGYAASVIRRLLELGWNPSQT